MTTEIKANFDNVSEEQPEKVQMDAVWRDLHLETQMDKQNTFL